MLNLWTTLGYSSGEPMSEDVRVCPESPHFESRTEIYEDFTILTLSICFRVRPRSTPAVAPDDRLSRRYGE